MALPKKQTKSQERSEKILKMRKEVLREIKKNEMVSKLQEDKDNQDGSSKADQPKERSVKKKKATTVSKKTNKQKKISVPQPKAAKKTFAVKEADDGADVKIEEAPKKEAARKEKVILKPKEDIPKKSKSCFFCSKAVQPKESDSSKAKPSSINSIIRRQKEPAQSSKKINIVVLFFVGLILGCVLFAALIFYVPKSESLPARKISEVVPLPAIIMNGKIIKYNDYLKEVDVVDLFLLRQQRLGIIRELPSRAQVREEIKDLLIKQEIIAGLANQYKITVSQKEIDDEIEKIKEQSRSPESFNEVLKNLYGWSEEEFGNKVVRNYLLISKLSNKMFPNVSEDESKDYFDKKVEEIKKGMNIYVLVE